jgi:hypothetical protein
MLTTLWCTLQKSKSENQLPIGHTQHHIWYFLKIVSATTVRNRLIHRCKNLSLVGLWVRFWEKNWFNREPCNFRHEKTPVVEVYIIKSITRYDHLFDYYYQYLSEPSTHLLELPYPLGHSSLIFRMPTQYSFHRNSQYLSYWYLKKLTYYYLVIL